jgi:glycosyltransferase involved in cell wall biosynthesis
MTIHIIGTVNGLTNEGMRNVATHIARCFEKEHTVLYSSLKAIVAVCRNARKADVTLVFARANRQVYWLMRLVEHLCKNTWLVCVQQPMDEFLERNTKHPLSCRYLYLSEGDMQNIPVQKRYHFPVGIDTQKFVPADDGTRVELKKKYGLRTDCPVVVHVGHCSSGRGLDAFFSLDREKYERLVVASGMFEDADVSARLEADGVRIHRGYLEHIEEIYQLADIYLFPTQNNEYVISIPLSVMEALACGTPVVGFKQFGNLAQIDCVDGSMSLISSAAELPGAIQDLACVDRSHSLLVNGQSWQDSANSILNTIRSATL